MFSWFQGDWKEISQLEMGKDQTHLCQVVLPRRNHNLIPGLVLLLEVWLGNGLSVLGVGVVGTLVILIMSSCLNLLKS